MDIQPSDALTWGPFDGLPTEVVDHVLSFSTQLIGIRRINRLCYVLATRRLFKDDNYIFQQKRLLTFWSFDTRYLHYKIEPELLIASLKRSSYNLCDKITALFVLRSCKHDLIEIENEPVLYSSIIGEVGAVKETLHPKIESSLAAFLPKFSGDIVSKILSSGISRVLDKRSLDSCASYLITQEIDKTARNFETLLCFVTHITNQHVLSIYNPLVASMTYTSRNTGKIRPLFLVLILEPKVSDFNLNQILSSMAMESGFTDRIESIIVCRLVEKKFNEDQVAQVYLSLIENIKQGSIHIQIEALSTLKFFITRLSPTNKRNCIDYVLFKLENFLNFKNGLRHYQPALEVLCEGIKDLTLADIRSILTKIIQLPPFAYETSTYKNSILKTLVLLSGSFDKEEISMLIDPVLKRLHHDNLLSLKLDYLTAVAPCLTKEQIDIGLSSIVPNLCHGTIYIRENALNSLKNICRYIECDQLKCLIDPLEEKLCSPNELFRVEALVMIDGLASVLSDVQIEFFFTRVISQLSFNSTSVKKATLNALKSIANRLSDSNRSVLVGIIESQLKGEFIFGSLALEILHQIASSLCSTEIALILTTLLAKVNDYDPTVKNGFATKTLLKLAPHLSRSQIMQILPHLVTKLKGPYAVRKVNNLIAYLIVNEKCTFEELQRCQLLPNPDGILMYNFAKWAKALKD